LLRREQMKKLFKVLKLEGVDGITRKEDNTFFPVGSVVELNLTAEVEKDLLKMGVIELHKEPKKEKERGL